MTLAASLQRPNNDCGVRFMPNVNESEEQSVSAMLTPPAVYLKVDVQDTGCGIEKPDLEHLFQRFQQGSPRTHVKYGGSGLGLFICKELARLQGGQIGVSSTPGEGATFAFFVRAIPCSSPQPEKHHGLDDKNQRVRHSGTLLGENDNTRPRTTVVNSSIQIRPAHILLVEDNMGKSTYEAPPVHANNSPHSEPESYGQATPTIRP